MQASQIKKDPELRDSATLWFAVWATTKDAKEKILALRELYRLGIYVGRIDDAR